MGKKSSPPPNYEPVANASREATQVSEGLAREQMAEARRQYEDQKEIARPVVDAQLEAMRQGITQGNDYYEYMKSRQRPIEDQLQNDALKDNTARDAAEIKDITDANTALAGKVGDIGARRAAIGEQYSRDLDGRLGAINNRFGRESGAALDGMRGAFGNAMGGLDRDMASLDGRIDGAGEQIRGDMARLDGRLDGAGEQIRGDMARLDGRLDRADRDIAGDLSRFDKMMGGVSADMRSAVGDARAAAARVSGAGGSIMGNSARHEGQIQQDIGLFTSGNDAIRAKYGKDIENDAALAQADARAGQSQAQGSAMRQAMRLGIDPASIGSDVSVAQASQQAAAANGARTASTDRYRNVVGQGIGMRQGLMNSSNQAAIAAANADIAGAGLGVQAAGMGMDAASRGADLAARRAGMGMDAAFRSVDAEARRAGMGMDASFRGLDAEARRAGMGMDASFRGVDAATRRAGMGMDRAGMAMDSAGKLAASSIDLSGRNAALDSALTDRSLAASLQSKEYGLDAEGAAAGILATNANTARGLRMQNDATGTAKKMDIAGMYRGLSGASQGAYGMAVGAGSAANANGSMAGNTLMQNMGNANQLQMGGRQLAMSGLTNVLNNQTSASNAATAASGQATGAIIGAGAMMI